MQAVVAINPPRSRKGRWLTKGLDQALLNVRGKYAEGKVWPLDSTVQTEDHIVVSKARLFTQKNPIYKDGQVGGAKCLKIQ